MASKYLNLEAAAEQLSLSVEELNRRREQGDIRAFADRGTWKFRISDVEELARTLDPDSSLDFGIMSNDGQLGEIPAVFDDDSNINLDEDASEQPTIISKKSAGLPPNSDSDVRLVVDPALEEPSAPGSSDSSDSDVRFVDDDLAKVEPTPIRLSADEQGSDIFAESDSDVRLSPAESNIIGGDPDSDVAPMPPGDDSVIRLEEAADDDEQSVLSDVITGPDSGLSFSSGDSGISLDLSVDSGLLFDNDDDDSITLASESGISLVPDSDVGLTLGDPLDAAGSDEAGGATIPMLNINEEDDANDTAFDMPLLEDSGEVASDDEDTTNIVMFDDDESDDQTMEFDSSEISNDDEFVDFDDDDSYDELSDGELDVGDDFDDDILEADDGDFDDDFESGESVPSLSLPAGMRGGAGVAVAADWDMVSFGLVLLSTGFMGICTLLMFDLVRSMWGYEAPIGVNGMILDTLQGIIKS
ncbi:MAG: hypothetical protein JKY95_14495 [Planctomycetaceae bacterium]|nr:hypothetical protein [Planctomycetaceae bacterium]